MLQLGNRFRRPRVLLATRAILVFAAGIERVTEHWVVSEGELMHAKGFVGDLEQANALNVARGAGKIFVDQRVGEAHRFENLRAAVGLIGRNAHLRHHLVEPLADRLDEVLRRVARRQLRKPLVQMLDRFQRQVRMDRFGAVAGEQRKMMNFARRARFDDQPGARAKPVADQVLMHRRGGQERRNRHQLRRSLAVGDDQDVVAEPGGVFRVRTQARQRRFHARRAPGSRVADVELERAKSRAGEKPDVADLFHFLGGKDRLLRLEAHRRIGFVDPEQIRARPDKRDQRHDQLFTDRVDRRIGDLREQLLEVAVENLGSIGEHRQSGIVAHRSDCLLAVFGHRREDDLQVFLGIAEDLLAVEQRHLRALRRRRIGQRIERNSRAVDPFAIRLRCRQRVLELVIVDDAALLGVDQKHLARLQPPLLDDLALGDVEHADFGCQNHIVIVGDDVTGRSQPVAVECRADLPAIGKGHGGGSVPRFHQRRVVLIECSPIVVHQRIPGPRFGDHEHHGVGQRIAAHHQQFQRIVERRGVRLPVIDQRPDLV